MFTQVPGSLGSAQQMQQILDQSPQHQFGDSPASSSPTGSSQPRGGQNTSSLAGNAARNSSTAGASDAVADNNASASPPAVNDPAKLSGSLLCDCECPKKKPKLLFGLWPCPEGQPTITLGIGQRALWNPAGAVDTLLSAESMARSADGWWWVFNFGYVEGQTDPAGLIRYDIGGESFLGLMFLRYEHYYAVSEDNNVPVYRSYNRTTATWSDEIVLTDNPGSSAYGGWWPTRRQGHLFFIPIGLTDGIIVLNCPSLLAGGRGFAIWKHSSPGSRVWTPLASSSLDDVQSDGSVFLRGSSLSVADNAVLDACWADYSVDYYYPHLPTMNADRVDIHLHKINPSTLSVSVDTINLKDVIEAKTGKTIANVIGCGLPVIDSGGTLVNNSPSTRWPHTGHESQPEFWIQVVSQEGSYYYEMDQRLSVISVNSRTGEAKVRSTEIASLTPVLANPTVISDNQYAAHETGTWAPFYDPTGIDIRPPYIGHSNPIVVGYFDYYAGAYESVGCLARDGTHPEIPTMTWDEVPGWTVTVHYYDRYPLFLPPGFNGEMGAAYWITYYFGVETYSGIVHYPDPPKLTSPYVLLPTGSPGGAITDAHLSIFFEPYLLIIGLDEYPEVGELRVLETIPVDYTFYNGPCETVHYVNEHFVTATGETIAHGQQPRYREHFRTYLRALNLDGSEKWRIQIGQTVNLPAALAGWGTDEHNVEYGMQWYEWAVRGDHVWVLHDWSEGPEGTRDIVDTDAMTEFTRLVVPHVSRYRVDTGAFVDRVSLRPSADSGNALNPLGQYPPHMILGTNEAGHHATVWSEWTGSGGNRYEITKITVVDGALVKTSDTVTAASKPAGRPMSIEASVSVAADGKFYYIDDCNKVNAVDM